MRGGRTGEARPCADWSRRCGLLQAEEGNSCNPSQSHMCRLLSTGQSCADGQAVPSWLVLHARPPGLAGMEAKWKVTEADAAQAAASAAPVPAPAVVTGGARVPARGAPVAAPAAAAAAAAAAAVAAVPRCTHMCVHTSCPTRLRACRGGG